MAISPHKGRGAVSAPDGRYSQQSVELDEEYDWERTQVAPETVLRAMRAGRIIAENRSPDVPFSRSINPYQGCEHGCVYCYARPSHSYIDLSPGLDFETRIFYKPNAAKRLLEAWEKPGYVVKSITLGANTDPYQPAERKTRVTRELIELFVRHRHPLNIITKGTLIERDLDLLSVLARQRLLSVAVSLPTLDPALKRIMEPRVPSATARLKTVERLTAAGIPVHVLAAPMIPAINDNELESVLQAAAQAGAGGAAYIFLRLPHEVSELFQDWLGTHFPDRAAHVMSLVRQASGGRDYDNRFGHRQTGQGPFAALLASRFRIACRKLGLVEGEYQQVLDTSAFIKPGAQQMGLGF
ncbi:MAG: PA0069 family radical SAM protein [Pseudomonadota bacterium]